MVQPGQVMGTRGPGGDRDYALYAMLISPNGMRSLFIADRLPTLKEVNIAFAHVYGRGLAMSRAICLQNWSIRSSWLRAPVLACWIACLMLLSPGLMVACPGRAELCC